MSENVVHLNLPVLPAGVRLDDPDLTDDDLEKAVEFLTAE
jgi:hypothetical protein